MNILSEISKGNANVEAIRAQLFDVVTLPLYPPALNVIQAEYDIDPTLGDTGRPAFVRPNAFGNYKHTGGDCLGVLGKDFRATQPTMLLDAFSSCLIDSGLDLQSLKYSEVQGGKRVRFSIDLEPTVFKNKAEVGDVVSNKLILQTGFDGYTATTFQIETEVLKCTNGMVAKDSSANVKFKNTQGNIGKISIVCDDIAQMVESSKDFSKLLLSYDKTSIDNKTVDAFCKATIGYSRKDKNELGKVKLARLDELMNSIDLELSRNGKTAWGLLNGLTHATNHVWSNNETRLDYLTVGAGLRTNNKAQKFLNELVLS
jgi:hypothetical protein